LNGCFVHLRFMRFMWYCYFICTKMWNMKAPVKNSFKIMSERKPIGLQTYRRTDQHTIRPTDISKTICRLFFEGGNYYYWQCSQQFFFKVRWKVGLRLFYMKVDNKHVYVPIHFVVRAITKQKHGSLHVICKQLYCLFLLNIMLLYNKHFMFYR